MTTPPPRRRNALRGLPVPSPSPSRGASVSSKATEKWTATPTAHADRRDYYTGFERAGPVVGESKSRSKKKGAVKEEQGPTSFDLGDTVLIRVERGLPAVGVIVEMWERIADEDAAPDDGPVNPEVADEEPGEKYVRVKWFQRVKELPSMMAVRLKRAGSDPDTQLYYTSFKDARHEFSPPLPTSLIISPCLVTCSPTPTAPLVTTKGQRKLLVEATVDIPAAAGAFQQGKLSIPARYWCAGIADSTSGEAWAFDNCLSTGRAKESRAKDWTSFQAEALRLSLSIGRKAWTVGRIKTKEKPVVPEKVPAPSRVRARPATEPNCFPLTLGAAASQEPGQAELSQGHRRAVKGLVVESSALTVQDPALALEGPQCVSRGCPG